jgi:hypothetical protein
MSLMHQHIRAYRTLADSLDEEAAHLKLEAPADFAILCRALSSMANAHRAAATILERHELALLDRVGPI